MSKFKKGHINEFSSYHRARKVRDILVTQKLENEGYKVLRFWEHEINNNLDKVIKTIFKILNFTQLGN